MTFGKYKNEGKMLEKREARRDTLHDGIYNMQIKGGPKNTINKDKKNIFIH